MASAMTERPIGFRPWEISAMVNMEVVAQHAEDAAFLWFSRDRAVGAPHYYLKDLVRLDERVEANIDGLRVAGSVGWDLAAKAIEKGEPGAFFAAAVLAFESKDSKRVDLVLGAAKDPALTRAVISAIGWMRFENAKATLESLSRSERPEIRRLAVASYAVHRVDPGELLRRSVGDADTSLQNRSFQAAAELGRTDLAYTIARYIFSRNESSRFYAAWSTARLGIRDRDVVATLRAAVESGGPHAERALQMALRCLRLDEAHAWLSEMLKDPKRLRVGVIGVGIVGDPARASELIGYMRVEQVARVAGEAFSMITGADLKYLDLDRPKPEAFEAGPNDNPNDPAVAMDEDDDLPWPAQEAVRKWWDKRQDEFRPGVRYLRGKPIDRPALVDALKNAYQRQRAAAALELALLRPSDPMFEVRAPGRRQSEALAQWNS
jgi:uncharacterized protein (TIGR02270 family)